MIKIISWKVIRWNQLWQTIWFPTANIVYNSNDIEDWVYKINIVINNKLFPWAWVYRKKINLFESFIFNFNKNIHWKEIEVILLKKIRENKDVDNLEEVKKLITNDVEIIKDSKNNILTFWTFDYVHKWHESFLNQAKKYWDKLITVVATDKNVEKFKWKKAKYNIFERIEHVNNLNISDKIVAWYEDTPMKWLEEYLPKVICLWYDQKWFSEKLKEYILKNNLDIEVIRLKAFKEDVYKSSLIKKTI